MVGFLKAKGLTRCPICTLGGGGGDLKIEPTFFELERLDPNKGQSLVIGGVQPPRHVFVNVFCGVCGHSMLFSAVVLGFFPRASAEEVRKAEVGEQGKQAEGKPPTVN